MTERELLLKLLYNDRINVSEIMSVHVNMEDIMGSMITEVHRYKISKSGDRWVTYVPDDTKPNGLRQIRKKRQSDLYEYLLDFYGVIESNLTFSKLYAEWVEYKRQFTTAKNKGLSPSTIRRYEKDFDNYFTNNRLSKMSINKITPIILQTELKNIIESNNGNEKPMYERCFNNIFGYITNMYEYAVLQQYIKESPAKFVDKKLLSTFCESDPVKPDKDRVLTIGEMAALLTAVREHEQRYPGYIPDYAVELAMLTGMRIGEIAVLHWTDIDGEYIHVDYSEHRLDYSAKYREYIIGEPKNRKHRQIPIGPDIAALFARIKALNISGEYVFSDNNGEWYREYCLRTALKRRAKEAGVTTSFHGIRRTVSSLLNASGLPRVTVANMLGHLPTTNERYYDYDFTEKADVIKAFSQVSYKVINFSADMTDKKTAESR